MKLFFLIMFNFLTQAIFSQNITSYSYDNLNRMTHINIAPCKLIQYQYDNEGNRISQTNIFIQVIDSIVKSCYGQSNGKIYLKPVISGSRYRYNWNTGFIGANLINVSPGQYSATITDSANNLSCQLQFNLGETPNDSFRIVKQDVTCYGLSNGEVKVVRDPSTIGTFKYDWSNGSHDSIIRNLHGISLSLIVTNIQTGCFKNYKVEIAQPSRAFFVFPNPTKSKVSIDFCSEKDDILDVLIFNSQGQQIQHFVRSIHISSNRQEFDFSQYLSGIYFIQLSFNGNRITEKVIKL